VKGAHVLVSVSLDHGGVVAADRERLAIAADSNEGALASLAAIEGIDEIAVVPASSGVEVFAAARSPEVAALALRQALAALVGRHVPLLVLHGEEAFRHLLRIVSGHGATVGGAPPIAGCAEDAFRRAADLGLAGEELAAAIARALEITARLTAEPAGAERILAEEVARWARAEAERRAVPLIQEMRRRASAIAREEVERTLRRLGEDPELATRLDAMAGEIVAKVLHQPSSRLRQAVAGGDEGEKLLAAAAHIFDLPSGASKRPTRAA
jgi:glutamyl-tRNA reductase